MAWHVFRGSGLNVRGIRITWAVVKGNEKQCLEVCLQCLYIPFRIPGTLSLENFMIPKLLFLPMSLPSWLE